MAYIDNADRNIEEESKPEPKRTVRTPKKNKKEKGEENGKK